MKAFAACSAGIDYIGWGTLVLYGTSAIFSPIFGKLATRFTVIPVMIFYYILMIATCIFMLFWQSSPDTTYMLFILAVLLGTIESINTPIPRGEPNVKSITYLKINYKIYSKIYLAIYGMIFKTEAIYSAFTFLQGWGFLFGFLVSTFCCTYIKIYILLGFCVLSFSCGVILYIRVKNEKHGREEINAHEMMKTKEKSVVEFF